MSSLQSELLPGYLTLTYRHCKRISSPTQIPSPIFLTLLKLYLRPTIPNPPNLLSPALSLIARHSARLDPIETLQLLPPLVNAHDVRPFLVQSLRAPVFDNCVVREVSLARQEDVERQLMKLESRRIKVTDSRMYVVVLFFLLLCWCLVVLMLIFKLFLDARSVISDWGTASLRYMRHGE